MAGKAFTKARVQDQYSHRFKIHFPNEERAAGRPVRTRPAYERQKEIGAIFGMNFGWEHPLWFAKDGEPREETIGFTRQNWWEPVGREARMLWGNAGIIDISNFAKYLHCQKILHRTPSTPHIFSIKVNRPNDRQVAAPRRSLPLL